MKNKLVRSIKFPLQYNAAKLEQEIRKILNLQWVNHYHTSDYNGDWNLLALLSVDGEQTSVLTNDNLSEALKKTPLLEKCPYIQEILDSLLFEKTAVRFMRLTVGAHIKPHTDYCLGYEDGVFRLHIPVITNPEVYFMLDDERLEMQPGECWYINANFTHEVTNKGSEDRIHLVIDGVRNAWTDELFFAHAEDDCFQKPVQAKDIDNLKLTISEFERQGLESEWLKNARLQLKELLKRAEL